MSDIGETAPRPETDESTRAAWYQEHKDDPNFLDNFEIVPMPNREAKQDSRTGPKTEQEWADYYQAHKDDLELWGEPVPPPKKARGRPSRNMGARISVRFTPEEMAGIRALAATQGVTYSEVVRRAVLAQARSAAD